MIKKLPARFASKRPPVLSLGLQKLSAALSAPIEHRMQFFYVILGANVTETLHSCCINSMSFKYRKETLCHPEMYLIIDKTIK